jgi:hypothetical protein
MLILQFVGRKDATVRWRTTAWVLNLRQFAALYPQSLLWRPLLLMQGVPNRSDRAPQACWMKME